MVFYLATNELADESNLAACFACFGRSGQGLGGVYCLLLCIQSLLSREYQTSWEVHPTSFLYFHASLVETPPHQADRHTPAYTGIH